ncbi:MAG: TauD/TfdA family dioxygenase, partial [Verrucomicrobiaceae bacterium]
HRTWQQSFQTEDRDLVERQVALMGSEMEWCDTGVLIRNPSRGFVQHPETGEDIWFNSIGGYGFSRRVIGDRMADLYDEYYGDGRPMPFGVDYGDGGEIDLADVAPLYDVTEKIQVALPWQKGDVFLLDNILVGHGRNTFEGDRKIRVSLLH